MHYIISLLFFVTFNAIASIELQVETGLVWQDKNENRIPGDNGTLFNLKNFNRGPFSYNRIEARYKTNSPHGLRLIYAPFRVSVLGTSDEEIFYNGSTFEANKNITINYQFNSYRMGYTYQFTQNTQLGLTLKVRDALVSLEQDTLSESYENVGFVPLFYFSYETPLFGTTTFYTDCDFAFAPQGRAIDLALKIRKYFSPDFKISFGLRSLEGGADNERVYNFSWFNYLNLDLAYNF